MLYRLAACLTVLIFLFLPVSCQDSEEDEATGEKAYQLGTTYAHYSDSFIEQSEKLYYGRPEIPTVLKLLDLKEGTVVGDIGCGVGAFTFPIAQAVGKTGKVYAVDIQAKEIDVVQKNMKKPELNPHNNIVALVNRPDDTLLPPDSLDVAWVSQVHFHNIPDLLEANKRMIASIFRTVKPGGRLVIGDEPNEHTPNPEPNIIRHYTEAGFVKEKGPQTDPDSPTTFYISFRKPLQSGN